MIAASCYLWFIPCISPVYLEVSLYFQVIQIGTDLSSEIHTPIVSSSLTGVLALKLNAINQVLPRPQEKKPLAFKPPPATSGPQQNSEVHVYPPASRAQQQLKSRELNSLEEEGGYNQPCFQNPTSSNSHILFHLILLQNIFKKCIPFPGSALEKITCVTPHSGIHPSSELSWSTGSYLFFNFFHIKI